MLHQKGASLLRKDQKRRLKYQEAQKIRGGSVSVLKDNVSKGRLPELSEGQVKVFMSKLIK